MEEDLSISDLRKIIRNLITFIVVEGKEYVNDTKKSDYVLSYVHLLARTINKVDVDEQESLVEDIANDISKYIK